MVRRALVACAAVAAVACVWAVPAEALSVVASPSSVAIGNTVTLSGDVLVNGKSACGPPATVILISSAFPGNDFAPGQGEVRTPVDATGHFNATVVVNPSAGAGTYTIVARCGGGTFAVTHLTANSIPSSQAVGGFSRPRGLGCGCPAGSSVRYPPGFWLVYANGSIATHRIDARNFGDAAALPLNSPIVGGAVTRTGGGYWLVASDGGIFSFGDAAFHGSTGAKHLNQPIVGMAVTPTGKGYWLVAGDGGVFSFGDATFHGSTANLRLNQPITGITSSPTGHGYWIAARDGGVFSFGDAPFLGSLPRSGVSATDVVGLAPTPTRKGYWIARSDGSTYPYGDAHNLEFIPNSPRCDPVVAIFSNPSAPGYRLVARSGATFPSAGQAPGGGVSTGTLLTC